MSDTPKDESLTRSSVIRSNKGDLRRIQDALFEGRRDRLARRLEKKDVNARLQLLEAVRRAGSNCCGFHLDAGCLGGVKTPQEQVDRSHD